MSKGVVPNYMSTLRDFDGDIRPLAHITANQKKRGTNVMPGKNI
jgi:hypothetical protein